MTNGFGEDIPQIVSDSVTVLELVQVGLESLGQRLRTHERLQHTDDRSSLGVGWGGVVVTVVA